MPKILVDGKCICKSGFIKKGEFECEVNQCIGGRMINGVCKCPLGKQQQSGKCNQKCKQREILENGKCIKNPCSMGQHLLNGKCINKPIPCPKGQDLVNGKCIFRRGLTPILKRPSITIRVGKAKSLTTSTKQVTRNTTKKATKHTTRHTARLIPKRNYFKLKSLNK